MHDDLIDKLKASPHYRDLVRRRSRLGWLLYLEFESQ